MGEGEQGGGQVGGFNVVVSEEVRLRGLSVGGGCGIIGRFVRLFSVSYYGGGFLCLWRGWLFCFRLL